MDHIIYFLNKHNKTKFQLPKTITTQIRVLAPHSQTSLGSSYKMPTHLQILPFSSSLFLHPWTLWNLFLKEESMFQDICPPPPLTFSPAAFSSLNVSYTERRGVRGAGWSRVDSCHRPSCLGELPCPFFAWLSGGRCLVGSQLYLSFLSQWANTLLPSGVVPWGFSELPFPLASQLDLKHRWPLKFQMFIFWSTIAVKVQRPRFNKRSTLKFRYHFWSLKKSLGKLRSITLLTQVFYMS